MLSLVVLGGAWPGMVTVETIGRIRRAFWVDKKPIRQIVRELRISRQTVRKAIRKRPVLAVLKTRPVQR
jgi:DNA invertase Pin-like site-specific DNA recombinase